MCYACADCAFYGIQSSTPPFLAGAELSRKYMQKYVRTCWIRATPLLHHPNISVVRSLHCHRKRSSEMMQARQKPPDLHHGHSSCSILQFHVPPFSLRPPHPNPFLPVWQPKRGLLMPLSSCVLRRCQPSTAGCQATPMATPPSSNLRRRRSPSLTPTSAWIPSSLPFRPRRRKQVSQEQQTL